MDNSVRDLKEYFRKRRGIRNSIIFSVVILLFSLVYFYQNWDNHNLLRTQTFNRTLVISLCALYIFGIVSWLYMKNNLASIYMLFYLYVLFSNLGQSLIHQFVQDDFTLFSVYGTNSLSIINHSLMFQVVCIAAMNVGAALGSYFYTKNHGIKDSMTPNDVSLTRYEMTQYDFILDILFYICAAATAAFFVYELMLRRTMSYQQLYESKETMSSSLRYGCVVLGIFYASRAAIRKKKIQEYGLYILWSVFIIVNMVIGTRSSAIVFIGSLLFMLRLFHPEVFKKKYWPIYIAGILAFLVALSMITVLRQSVMSNASINNLLGRGIIHNIQQTIYEFGISEYPAIITIGAVEKGLPHYQTILYYLTRGFIPSQILDLLGFHEPDIGLVAVWATKYSNFTSGETGYSIVAEAFLNYGRQGWIFFMLYGGLITYWELLCARKIKDGKLLFSSLFIYLLSKQIFYARYSMDIIGTSVRYTFFIWILYMIILYRKQRLTPNR